MAAIADNFRSGNPTVDAQFELDDNQRQTSLSMLRGGSRNKKWDSLCGGLCTS